MTFWQYLDRRTPDARGWTGIGIYSLVIYIFWMMNVNPKLLESEYFRTIATLIIGTAYVNGAVSWAYAATKAGGELADRNASIVEKQANASPPIKEEK